MQSLKNKEGGVYGTMGYLEYSVLHLFLQGLWGNLTNAGHIALHIVTSPIAPNTGPSGVHIKKSG